MKNLKSFFYHMAAKGYLNWLPDKEYLKLMYRLKVGRKLHLDNPKTFNEKLQWLKLYNRKEFYSSLVDKYEVRQYVKKKVGEQYLVPIFGVWDKFDDIDFNMLPKKFVIKCTHDSGGVIICKDKDKLNMTEARNKIQRCLDRNFYYWGREWPYKNVKPRIIVEQYLEDESGDEIKDYKFMVFNGKVKCSFVCSERYSEEGLAVDFYDLNWNKMPFMRKYRNSDKVIEKPKNYEKMIELAEKLSVDMIFDRIDFYEINGNIYFGEITLYPGGGFEKFIPGKYDTILGEMLEIDKNMMEVKS